jgi:tetratricopeptide (TPR) repeat protein
MVSRCTGFAVVVVVVSSVAVLAPRTAAGQDALANAKGLYASAQYEEALSALNRVENASELVEADQYRALCLLALGRSDDARQIIQRIVEQNPSYEPSEAQMSPRVQETFRDVRRRVLPSIVKQEYADAKAAFADGEVERAKGRFERVVLHLDALDAMGSKDLGDLRILSTGFLDLMNSAAKAVALPVAPPATENAAREAAPPPPPSVPTIHGAGEPDVVAPVALSQVMPPWRPGRQETQTHEGILAIVIDETGAVTEVTVLGNLPPAYRELLKRAAGSWRFQPATRNGVPVAYRKIVSIRLRPE